MLGGELVDGGTGHGDSGAVEVSEAVVESVNVERPVIGAKRVCFEAARACGEVVEVDAFDQLRLVGVEGLVHVMVFGESAGQLEQV
jgi:hypothetical protein